MKRFRLNEDGSIELEVFGQGLWNSVACIKKVKDEDSLYKKFRVSSQFLTQTPINIGVSTYVADDLKELEHGITKLIYGNISKKLSELEMMKTALEEEE